MPVQETDYRGTGMSVDVLVVGSISYNVSDRYLTADSVSKQCIRRQYVELGTEKLFYFDFLNQILDDIGSTKKFRFIDIPTTYGKELTKYLRSQNIGVQYIGNFDNDKEKIKCALENGTKVVIFKLGNMYNALPMIRAIKFLRRIDSLVKIIVSGLYIYNKFATDTPDNFLKMKETIGADYYITDISDYYDINRIVKEEVSFANDVSCDNNSTVYENEEELFYVNTSIGCLAKCNFCNFPIRNKEYHTVDLAELKKSLNQIEIHKRRYVCFLDDTLNLPREHFFSVCNLMIENKYTFEWFAYCRLKELSEDAVQLMRKSHCKGVFVGIESADDSMLHNMNKGATKKDFEEKLALLKKYDIMVFAFILVGFPGENAKTVQETIDFINNSPIDFFTANLWYADVSTPIFSKAAEYELIGKDFLWKHRTMNSETASEYTDMVLSKVTTSTWVPNENFGFQAVVYLMDMGMQLDDIKVILGHMKKLIECNINNCYTIQNESIYEIKKILRKYFA